MTIVQGTRDAVVSYINGESDGERAKGRRVGVLCAQDTAALYRADMVKSAGGRDKPEEIAERLFRLLREFDGEETEIIYAEAFADTGLGEAIMNRLKKAAGGRIVRV